MKIEFLYFKACPGYEFARSLLEQVLLENRIHAPIEIIEVTSQEQAIQYRFLGSPSIRINGKDIEDCDNASEYGLKCRIYSNASNAPSKESLCKALLEAQQE